MPGRSLRIALAQGGAAPDPARSLDQAAETVARAAAEGAHVVCLPELFRTAYFPQEEAAEHFDLAEPVPGPTSEALGAAAREHRVVVVASIFERRAPGVYHNSALVLDATGEIAGHYRKMHIPDDPGFYEKYYFTPGDKGFFAVDTVHGRIAVLICWDQWFPEGARLAALDGASVLFYPTAIGWIPDDDREVQLAQRDAWITIQRSHAIANGVFVAAVNRAGREGNIQFYGSSFLADPGGVIRAQAQTEKAELLVVDCDLDAIEIQRRAWPFLRDRRIDAYGDLAVRFRR
jgi:N-carbamoylputrescine amidase